MGSHNAGQCRLHSYCHVYIFKAQAIMGRAKFVVNSFKECRADVRNFSTLHSCRAKAVAKTSKNAEEPKLSHQSCRKHIQKCRTAVTKVFGFCICAAMRAPYTTHTRVHDQPNQIPYTQAPFIQPTLVLPSVDSRPLSPHRLLARDADFSSRHPDFSSRHPLPFPPSS